ncbi:uncharacterized protein BCR38DRAFT_413038 [Pseudomassariella vexata]|uniref:Uncharacterized protein n=1 Tax=Pseudomassariella vexata TaxID=1141098 RepID=A0A1Y2DHJ9_9PEZI|nr:uncharacterized protein BCR38DRAFT_413038 [Pseudomassariella vexata]ORY58719.1 hypothetical protein BCR38DRAFT_413038 [Pseudomassariella vexata]
MTISYQLRLNNIKYPDSNTYESHANSILFLVDAVGQLDPTCIFQLATAKGVALAITALVDARLDLSFVAVAILSGRVRTTVGQVQMYEQDDICGKDQHCSNTVVVAGFLTGGGKNFFTAKRCWSCDNIINYEIVLASR